MKILVCGGRRYRNQKHLFRTLDDLHGYTPITLIIQGGAKGADFLAKRWATERGVPYKQYDADWDRYSNDAGPIRNAEMLDDSNPDFVLAFMTGSGPGTKHMVNLVRRRGRQLVEIHDDGPDRTGTAEKSPGQHQRRRRVRPNH